MHRAIWTERAVDGEAADGGIVRNCNLTSLVSEDETMSLSDSEDLFVIL